MLLNFSDRTRTGVFNMVWPLPKSNDKISLVFLPKDNFYYIMRPTQSVSEALYYASDTVWDLEKFSNSETMTLSSQPLGLVIFFISTSGTCNFFISASGTCNFFRNVELCFRHTPCRKHNVMRPTQIQTLRKKLRPQNPDLQKKTS